jgi:hypothetical protein
MLFGMTESTHFAQQINRNNNENRSLQIGGFLLSEIETGVESQ